MFAELAGQFLAQDISCPHRVLRRWKAVQAAKRLRHSTVSIASDTYGHLIGGIGRDAAERAAALVPRRASGS
jgi:hypothetical protein